jgi:hypothetical protein
MLSIKLGSSLSNSFFARFLSINKIVTYLEFLRVLLIILIFDSFPFLVTSIFQLWKDPAYQLLLYLLFYHRIRYVFRNTLCFVSYDLMVASGFDTFHLSRGSILFNSSCVVL